MDRPQPMVTASISPERLQGAASRPIEGASPRPPDCPRNWYLVAASADIAPGGVSSASIGGHEIVLFRPRSGGALVALAGLCRHAGCHLKHAATVARGLRCPLHHRVIDPQGWFLKPDGSRGDMAQPTLPVVETLGGVFVWVGASEPFELPRPAITTTGPFATTVMRPLEFGQPWSALIANGMDIDHLSAVHDRKLREPPTLEEIDAHRMRLDYRTQVIGRHLSDRVMKWLSGDDIRGRITCIGGSIILVEATIKSRQTFILLSMLPTAGNGSVVRGMVGIRGEPKSAVTRARLATAAWLFRSFLRKDVGILDGMRWHAPNQVHTAGDAMTRQLYDFFCRQPSADTDRSCTTGEPGPGGAGEFGLHGKPDAREARQ